MKTVSWRSKVIVALAAVVILQAAVGVLPGLAAPGEAPQAWACNSWYWVRPGDTLASISRLYGVDMWSIARANRITNLNRIWVGMPLYIPCGGYSSPPGYGGYPGSAGYSYGDWWSAYYDWYNRYYQWYNRYYDP